MDGLTHGLLGAVAAQAVVGPRGGKGVWIAGFAGGLIADADVVLMPFADPALPRELHRHFTHGLVMAPVMGLLAGLILLLFPTFRRLGSATFLASIVGALTHPPLDLLTGYGTKIYWPFSMEDAAIDLFPMVDPILAFVLALCIFLGVWRSSRRPALAAAAFLVLYAGMAIHLHGQAVDVQSKLAADRGHDPVRSRVIPVPGSLFAWRSLYEADGQIVADLVRPLPFGPTKVVEGGSLPIVREADVLVGAHDADRVRDVYRRFETFADGWTARLPTDDSAVGDMRFAVDAGFRTRWALRIGRRPDEPAVSWLAWHWDRSDAASLTAVIFGAAKNLRSIDFDGD